MNICSENDKCLTDLLLILTEVSLTDEQRARAEHICRQGVEWRRFTDLSVRHGVAALVAQNLSDNDLAKFVDGTERQILEGARVRTVARVAFVSETAAAIIEELEKKGIKALYLKGLALEHTVYGSRGLRQMSDIDILVSPVNAASAARVLEEAGFTATPLKSWLYRFILQEIGNHLPEMRKGGVSVDIHFRLFGREAQRLVAIAVENAYRIENGGRSFYIVPPRTAFLALVKHLEKHEVKGEFQLRLYNDIRLLLKAHHGEILDNNTLAEAEEAGIAGNVRRVMLIMRMIFGLEVPESMAATDGSEIIVSSFMQNLLNPAQAPVISPEERYRETLKSLSSCRVKLIYILGDIFPSTGFMKKRYGCSSSLMAVLYYPHRLGKVFWWLKSLRRL